jgi:BON domain-containing protein
MAEEKNPGQGSERRPPPKRRNHHRRHGYRGYGSGFDRGTGSYGGAVHWGRGFGGVGAPQLPGGTTLPEAGLFTAEVWERGPYRGLAPRGYSRSDERIREDICDELTRRSDIDPSRLSVRVENGDVTLEGTVRDLETRRLVDEVASRSVGVRQVHNELRIEERTDGSSSRKNGLKRNSR